MRKNLIIGLSAAAIFSSASYASDYFDGPYAQLAVGGVNTSAKASAPSATGWVANSNPSASGSNFLGQVLLGYSKSFSGFNLAGNVFYDIGNQKPKALNYDQGISDNVKFKNTWGLSLEPGYYLSEKTLGYLKLSYYGTGLNVTSSYPVAPSATYTKNLNGVGYGLGFKQGLTDSLYGFAEYQFVQYSNITNQTSQVTYKNSQNYGWVGLGYRF